MIMSTLRNALLLGACCASNTAAFTTPTSDKVSTALHRSLSPNFSDSNDGPDRPGFRRGQEGPAPFTPRMANGPPPRESYQEPASVDLGGQVQDRQSNLFHRRNQSVNEDPRAFDMGQRFSQRPNQMSGAPSTQPRKSWWESTPDSGRVQGGSRTTYDAPHDRDSSHVFLESDGRPIDVEFGVWDGPNNTPTKMKVYSEDGRLRPINILTANPQRGRGNTLSVKNTGPMEFPINAGVNSVGGGMSAGGMSAGGQRGGLAGSESAYGGLAGNEGAYMDERDLNGFTHPSSPSMKRGQTVQGESLRTFPLDYSVEAVQVTITTDGNPMNAKVELWGTSSHIKQVAEVYNDNGLTRPFAAIIDVPGGSNTIAVYNTGPIVDPFRVVVEPVARMDGWDGKEDQSVGGHLAPW